MTTITENTTIKKAEKKDNSSMLDKGFTEEALEATEEQETVVIPIPDTDGFIIQQF